MALIKFSNKGLYCPAGDFYIDPWLPVEKAIISHGHADHARFGNQHYLCTPLTGTIIKQRISPDLNVQTLPYGQAININGVQVTFYPAGHVIGSAQVKVEYKGEVWVFTGDYKLEDDGISTPYEPVQCQHFITECTFGLPVYRWQPQALIMQQIQAWATENIAAGRTTILIVYSLGKAQRLLHGLSNTIPVYTHSSISRLNNALTNAGVNLPAFTNITPELSKAQLQQGILILPPVMRDSKWVKSLQHPVVGVCSGWMQVRSHRRWQSADAGFPLSDHADFTSLNQAVKNTGAQYVYPTHGFTSAYARYLNEQGYIAHEVKTNYGSEEELEAAEDTAAVC